MRAGAWALTTDPGFARALIIGAGGQLGRELARLLPDSVALSRERLSILDPIALEEAVDEVRPEVVFNASAYNAVDRAEAEPEQAMAINAEGPGQLAAICHRARVRLVHFSTNYVFDGTSGRPYVESDAPNPLGAYARSKREGEELVLAAAPDALVIRTAVVFGVGGQAVKGGSFPERILERAAQGAPLRVVEDQTVNPTYAPDLAARAIELATSEFSGLLHVVAEGCCSFHELAKEAVALAGLDVPVEAVSSQAFPTPAARPRNGCLASELVPPLRHWRQALVDFSAAYSATQTRSAVVRQP